MDNPPGLPGGQEVAGSNPASPTQDRSLASAPARGRGAPRRGFAPVCSCSAWRPSGHLPSPGVLVCSGDVILSRFWREGSERCRGAGFSPGSPRRPPRRRRLDASSPPRGVRIASPPNLQSSSRSRPTASCMLLPASRRYGNPPIPRDGLLAPRTWWTRWKDGLRTLPTSRMLGPRSCSSAAARCTLRAARSVAVACRPGPPRAAIRDISDVADAIGRSYRRQTSRVPGSCK